jgi:hypothetical protein
MPAQFGQALRMKKQPISNREKNADSAKIN